MIIVVHPSIARKRGRILLNSEFLPPRESCMATKSPALLGSIGESELTSYPGASMRRSTNWRRGGILAQLRFDRDSCG